MKYNPFTDYDKLGCLKLPWSLYLTLAFLLRGYVIWVVALSNRQEGDALLNLFYPSRHDFTMALLFGLPALLCGALISLRRETMPKFVEWSWYKIRLLMGLSAPSTIGLCTKFRTSFATQSKTHHNDLSNDYRDDIVGVGHYL